LPQGFEGSGFLLGGRGSCAGSGACTTGDAEASTNATTCNAADKARLDDALCTFGQIKVAGFASDDALAGGFAQHFAAGTEGRSLPNAARSTADKTTGYTLNDIAADLAPENTPQSGAESRSFHAADGGA
jgi:hypothetical protein